MILIFSYYYLIFYFLFMVAIYFFKIHIPEVFFRFLNIFFVLGLGIIAYNFIPEPQMDLTRYIDIIRSMRGMTWETAQEYGEYGNTFLANFLFFVTAKYGLINWLPVISTSITYGVILLLSGLFRGKEKVKSFIYAYYIIALLGALSIVGVISGIRQPVAWSILFIAVSYELLSKQSKWYTSVILYLIPVSIHLSVIPIVLIKFASLFIKNVNILKYFLVLWPLSIGILENYTGQLPTILSLSINRLVYYLEGFSIASTVLTPKYFIVLVSYIIFMVIHYELFVHSNGDELKNNKFFLFYELLLYFGISSLFIPTLFTRMFDFFMIISLPFLNKSFNTNSVTIKLLLNVLLILYIFLFLYQDVNAPHFLNGLGVG